MVCGSSKRCAAATCTNGSGCAALRGFFLRLFRLAAYLVIFWFYSFGSALLVLLLQHALHSVHHHQRRL